VNVRVVAAVLHLLRVLPLSTSGYNSARSAAGRHSGPRARQEIAVPAPLNGLMHRVFEAGTLRALTVSRRSAGAAYPSMMTASTVRGLDMGRPARDPPFGGDSQRLRADVRISGIDGLWADFQSRERC
jgi:hypothetical protein